MRSNIITIIVYVLVLLVSAPAFAGGGSKQSPAETDPTPRVQIVEDQAAAAFRFMIDGREVARLDPDGLHVRENIEYGGTLTDAGTAYYDAKAKQSTAPAGAR
jgi:hypothetical protein